jgi:hypothetical protein
MSSGLAIYFIGAKPATGLAQAWFRTVFYGSKEITKLA